MSSEQQDENLPSKKEWWVAHSIVSVPIHRG